MNNLLKRRNLDSIELRVLLHELIGGTGQSDDLGRAKPRNFYIPLAGPSCRVVLTFDGKKVIDIKPGEASDAAQWQQINNEIEHSILAGHTKVGREYSFSGRRVKGSWQGEHSGVQILPPPADASSAPLEQADHSFILEFPLMVSSVDALTNYRRLRKHRDLTLLLNVLLVGGAKSMGFRPTSFWAYEPSDLSQTSKWVPQGFFAPLGACLIDQLSAPAAHQLKELTPEEYDAMLGNDGEGLRVPSNLDQPICSYEALSALNREKFDRAAFWFGTATGMRDVSVSASFAAFVSAIESLTARGTRHNFKCPVCSRQGTHIVQGPTKLFRNFLASSAALNGRTSRTGRKPRGIRHKFLRGIHTTRSHSQSIACLPSLSRETQVNRLNSSLPRLRSELLSCGSQGLLETGFVQKSSSAPCWSTFDNSRKNCSCSENAICC